jgi:hypothetical protein
MMGDLSHLIFETMATLELTDEEKLALAAELKHTIAEDRYPLSPRVRTLQGILDKLEKRRFWTETPTL